MTRWAAVLCAASTLAILTGCTKQDETPAPQLAKPGERGASTGTVKPDASGPAAGSTAQPAGN